MATPNLCMSTQTKAPKKKPGQLGRADLERLASIEGANLDYEEGERLPFRYAMVHAVMDTVQIERVDDDGYPYKATKVVPRTRGILIELNEMIQHPETGASVLRPRPFHMRLPFSTYSNKATRAGFKSEQIIRYLLKMDRCARGPKPQAAEHFYLVPVTADEIKQKQSLASDPEIAKKLAKLQAQNNAPLPRVEDLMFGEANEKADVLDTVEEELREFAA